MVEGLRVRHWARYRHFRAVLGLVPQFLALRRSTLLFQIVSNFLGSYVYSVMDDYLCFEEPWFRSFIESSRGAVVDIGAGDGYFTRKFARHAQVVYAFEPNPGTFGLLCEKTRHLKNVVCKELAVGDQDGKTDLFTIPFGSAFSSITFPSSHSTKVRCVTLNSIEVDGRVSTIKIDCEGAEVLVLRGGYKFISKHRPELLIEVHGVNNKRTLEGELCRLGYSKHILAVARSELDRLHRYWLVALPMEVTNSQQYAAITSPTSGT
jgi:FkbM family methyltransferase